MRWPLNCFSALFWESTGIVPIERSYNSEIRDPIEIKMKRIKRAVSDKRPRIKFEKRPTLCWPTMLVRSILVTDVGDEMCWRQLFYVDDGFGHSVKNIHYLHFTLVSATNIEIQSPTSTNRNHYPSKKHVTLSYDQIGEIKLWRQS